ncbi:MAG: hypothetical protein H6585_14970 [Flavobacteriales bacterium]|nr:hypothetical protein [Flavobacteriales bacterium]MCB9449632.1 hypothetical protein [Flavobacteriales bacterium]
MSTRFVFFLFLSCTAFVAHADTCVNDTIKKHKPKTEKVLIQAPGTDLGEDCKKIEVIRTVIEQAISIGAPTYNQGNHIGCYMIYEGAAYKILYRHANKCRKVTSLLEAALEEAQGDHTATEKAWIMRIAFDQILGVPTTTK